MYFHAFMCIILNRKLFFVFVQPLSESSILEWYLVEPVFGQGIVPTLTIFVAHLTYQQ